MTTPSRGTSRRLALTVPAVATCGLGLSGCSGSSTGASSSSGPVTVPVADVPVAGGTVVSGVVVTQPEKGTFHAFDARCPHQGCAVSSVSAEAITCPCHGSTFDPATGDVTGGPAKSGLAARQVAAEGDSLTIT